MRSNIIGESPEDIFSQEVYQVYSDTCAIKSQELILKDFGYDLTQDQLIDEAMEMNIFERGVGTMPQDVGKLLELHGVAVDTTNNANILDLTRALAQGHKVIIGVDSGELWEGGIPEMFEDLLGGHADHALIVAGIDVSTNEVILTDPGSGAEGSRYPMDKFLDAWQDSGNLMVETEQPAPANFCPEMTGFDYDAGHIDNIGAMPWDFFENQVLPLSLHDTSGWEITFDGSEQTNPVFADFRDMVNGNANTFSVQSVNFISVNVNLSDLDGLDLSVKFDIDEITDDAKEPFDLFDEDTDTADDEIDIVDNDEFDDELDDLEGTDEFENPTEADTDIAELEDFDEIDLGDLV